MKRSSIVLILYVCATVAQGGVIVSAPGSGWAGSAGAGEGEYRWGATDRTMRPAIGDWELGVGSGHAMDGQGTGLLDLTSLFSNATPSVEGFVDGIDGFVAGYGKAPKPQYIHLNHSDGQLSDMDFVLEGTLYIDWAGAVSSTDEMGMHLKMTQIPEPASILLVAMVSGLGLFIRRKFGS